MIKPQQAAPIACPNCGDADHIYAHADARWNSATQEWEIRHYEEMLDCTNCDHEWLYRDSFAPSHHAAITKGN